MTGRKLAILLLTTSALLVAAASSANAGTYTTYSCRTPTGHVVPTEGWSEQLESTGPTDPMQEEGSSSGYFDADDQCRASPLKVLAAGLKEHHTWYAGDRASLVYSAPPDTSIAGFTAAACSVPATSNTGTSITWTGPGYTSPGGFRAPYGGQLGCSSSTAFTYLSASSVTGSSLYFSASCLSTPCHWDNPNYSYLDSASSPSPSDAPATATTAAAAASPCLMATCWTDGANYVAVGALAATLRDDLSPAVAGTSGTLTSGGPHSGTESVTFNATDRGSGVYRAVAQLKPPGAGEWQTVARSLVDMNGGKCIDAGEKQTDDYEFVNRVPCKLAVTASSLSVDTGQFPPGTSEFRAYVEDAAGNRADILMPRPFTVAGAAGAAPSGALGEPPVAHLAANNGLRASRTALMRLRGRGDRQVRYGQRVQLAGRLMDDHGRPIAGASLEVVARVLLPSLDTKGSWEPIGAVVTDKRGRFAVRVPASMSRSVAVVYRANLRDQGWTTTAQTDVRVSAGVKLQVADDRVRNKQRVFFRGRVAGDVPKGGLLVTIQVLGGSVWIPVATTQPEIHTDGRGRFEAAYKFQRTYTAASFRFRAVAHRDSAFPFELGRSNPVRVHVRP